MASIVQQHQGWIDVDSTVGVGTTVKVYLPLVARRARDTAPPAVARTMTPPPPIGHGELVIVCDPDLADRERAAHLLRSLGYAVLAVADAAEANARAADPTVDVAVLVAAAELGSALGDALRATRADLALVVVVDDDDVIGTPRPDVTYLRRPVAGAPLAEAVAEALRRRR